MKLKAKIDIPCSKDGCPVNIEKVEEKYKAKFVGMLPPKDSNGNWLLDPVPVFYVANPNRDLGHTNYFYLVVRNGTVLIGDGLPLVDGSFVGAKAQNGEIIYSNSRWDMRYSEDRTVYIDGGRDYVKTNTGNLLEFVILDGDFYEIEVKH